MARYSCECCGRETSRETGFCAACDHGPDIVTETDTAYCFFCGEVGCNCRRRGENPRFDEIESEVRSAMADMVGEDDYLPRDDGRDYRDICQSRELRGY